MLNLQCLKKHLDESSDAFHALEQYIEAAYKHKTEPEADAPDPQDIADELDTWNRSQPGERWKSLIDILTPYLPDNDLKARFTVIETYLLSHNPMPAGMFNEELAKIPDKYSDEKIKPLVLWLYSQGNAKEAAELIGPIITSIETNTPTQINKEASDAIQLLQAIPKTEHEKARAVLAWLTNTKNDISQKTLDKIYTHIELELFELRGLTGWASEHADGFERMLHVCTLVAGADTDIYDALNDDNINEILSQWCSNPKNIISDDNLKRFLGQNNSDTQIALALKAWVIKNGKNIQPDIFIELITLCKYKYIQEGIAKKYLDDGLLYNSSDSVTLDLTVEQMKVIIPLIRESRVQKQYILEWEKQTQHTVSIEEMEAVVATIDDPDFDQSKKSAFILEWAEKSDSQLNTAMVLGLLRDSSEDHLFHNRGKIESLIERNKISYETFLEVLETFKNNNNDTTFLINTWIFKNIDLADNDKLKTLIRKIQGSNAQKFLIRDLIDSKACNLNRFIALMSVANDIIIGNDLYEYWILKTPEHTDEDLLQLMDSIDGDYHQKQFFKSLFKLEMPSASLAVALSMKIELSYTRLEALKEWVNANAEPLSPEDITKLIMAHTSSGSKGEMLAYLTDNKRCNDTDLISVLVAMESDEIRADIIVDWARESKTEPNLDILTKTLKTISSQDVLVNTVASLRHQMNDALITNCIIQTIKEKSLDLSQHNILTLARDCNDKDGQQNILWAGVESGIIVFSTETLSETINNLHSRRLDHNALFIKYITQSINPISDALIMQYCQQTSLANGSKALETVISKNKEKFSAQQLIGILKSNERAIDTEKSSLYKYWLDSADKISMIDILDFTRSLSSYRSQHDFLETALPKLKFKPSPTSMSEIINSLQDELFTTAPTIEEFVAKKIQAYQYNQSQTLKVLEGIENSRIQNSCLHQYLQIAPTDKEKIFEALPNINNAKLKNSIIKNMLSTLPHIRFQQLKTFISGGIIMPLDDVPTYFKVDSTRTINRWSDLSFEEMMSTLKLINSKFCVKKIFDDWLEDLQYNQEAVKIFSSIQPKNLVEKSAFLPEGKMLELYQRWIVLQGNKASIASCLALLESLKQTSKDPSTYLNLSQTIVEQLKNKLSVATLSHIISNLSPFEYSTRSFSSALLRNTRLSPTQILKLSQDFSPEEHRIIFLKAAIDHSDFSADDLISLLKGVTSLDVRCELAHRWLLIITEQDKHSDLLMRLLQSGVLTESDPQTDQAQPPQFENWSDLSVDAFMTLLKNIPASDIKNKITSCWLDTFNDSPETRIDHFVQAIQSGGLINLLFANDRALSDCYINSGFSTDSLVSFCKKMFPQNEMTQVEIFSSILPYLDRSKDKIQPLKAFAESLHDDDQCLAVIHSGRNLGLQRSEILTIVNKRVRSNFKSLSQLLKLPIEESLTPDGMNEFNQSFSNADKNLTLSALFAYYALHDNIAEFMTLLKDDVKTHIREQFVPSDASPYISQKEYAQLIELGVKDLPNYVELCHYLKTNLNTVPPFEENVMALNDHIASMGAQAEGSFEQLFGELLDKGENATHEDVHQFFNTIMGYTIKEGEADKLYSLFKNDKKKNELTFLFSMENGISDYVAIVSMSSAGCAANIGTTTNIYLISKLLKTQEASLLYPFFIEKVVTPILSQRGVDLLGGSSEGINPFSEASIYQSRISPPGLYISLYQNLVQNEAFKPQDIIGKLAQNDESDEFFCSDAFLHSDNPSEVQAKFCAYLIIRKLLPDTFNHPSFEPYKQEMEDIWNQAEPDDAPSPRPQ